MRSLLKEPYINDAFQEIQTRGCSYNKPESNTFRTELEKLAGTRGDTKITEALYDVSVSSCYQSIAIVSVEFKM
jgi:hypothetical protein